MKKIIYFPFILIFLFNSNANAQCETNYQGCVINFSPLEVNFEGNPSGSTTGINSYTWDFGDGQTGTGQNITCLLYTSPSPRDRTRSRMPSSA